MTFDAAKRARGLRLRKIWFLVSVGLIVCSAIAWLVFWQISASALGRTLDAWLDQEAKAGHNWTCPEKKISGFPFSIEISCANPQFDGEISGKTIHGSLAGFRGFASLFQPNKVTALFQPPFSARSEASDFSFRLDWRFLEAALEGGPEKLQKYALQASDLALEGSFGGLGTLAGKAGNLSVLFTRLAGLNGHNYAFGLNLTDGTSPELERFLDSALPADLKLNGTITEFDLRGAGNTIEKIEDWRMSGGHADLDTAEFVQAQLKLAAKGQLGLDSGHRIKGKLEAQLTGFGPILRRYGINPVLLDAASLIGALTGKSQNKPGGEPPSLRVPLTFANGVLSIGPLRTPFVLEPLY